MYLDEAVAHYKAKKEKKRAMLYNYISGEKKEILQPLDSISVVRLYQSVITRAHANSTLLFDCGLC